MSVKVVRKNIEFFPDSSRVIARFFDNGEVRTRQLLIRILGLSEREVKQQLHHILMEFAGRHRNISKIFADHSRRYTDLIDELGYKYHNLSIERLMLIGSYATMEYSIESAALFNPSIVADSDQSFLQTGEKRVIISFRAVGEGHLSSIVFRRGILDKENNLKMMKVRSHIDMAEFAQKTSYDKKRFIAKLKEMEIEENYFDLIMGNLPDRFEYHDLKAEVNKILVDESLTDELRLALEEITWLVDSYYDLEFDLDSDISERVLFPVSPSESQGIEDARFVTFHDNNETTVYATYTAFNGHTIIPKLISTKDFRKFRIMPIHGRAAQNKNFALFPRKINGKFAMLARIDGVNNYLIYSDRINLWNDPIKIQEPKFPWEFVQIGNCGPPIETHEGWLVLTHGVGPMRRYCIGASLFQLDDPTIELGRLKEPLLCPLEEEREGYVPNVVYSCGALLHNDSLILPYAVSDYKSSYAVVDFNDLLNNLIKG